MNRAMKLFTLLAIGISLLGISCERHEFDGPDGTRQLHEPHDSHDKKGDHGDSSAD